MALVLFTSCHVGHKTLLEVIFTVLLQSNKARNLVKAYKCLRDPAVHIRSSRLLLVFSCDQTILEFSQIPQNAGLGPACVVWYPNNAVVRLRNKSIGELDTMSVAAHHALFYASTSLQND